MYCSHSCVSLLAALCNLFNLLKLFEIKGLRMEIVARS